MPRLPIEFVQRLANGVYQRVGNVVQLAAGSEVSLAAGTTVQLDTSVTVPVETKAGESVDVFIQDQSSPLVDCFFTTQVNAATLAVNTNIDDTTVTLAAGHGVVAGNIVLLQESSRYRSKRY